MTVDQSRHIIQLLICTVMSVILMSGCSDTAQPDNIEPEIELLEVTGITRTEAVISARVIRHGSGRLTHIAFHYGVTGTIDQTVPADAGQEILTCHLTGLRPGTSYSWYVEGGTSTATLRTGTVTFTTDPNVSPSVSALTVLSTGPMGVIVSFDIDDDGGEPVLEAGCEILNRNTMGVTRMYLSPESLTEGTHRLHIGGLSLETSYTITPFASNTTGESMGEPVDYTTQSSIVLDEPGSLSHLFDNVTAVELGQLTVSGAMNGDDFRFLRALLGAPALPDDPAITSAVTSVDLSDAIIRAGGDTFDGRRYTATDELSTGLFADCARLHTIVLPSTATVMARDAFARCPALEELTIPAAITDLLPSAGCPALRDILVSKANEVYSSVDGVLFTRDGTEILWFPTGKTGAFTLPATITSIGENAFAGTNITGLEIPASVTTISRGAFAGTALTDILLPDNITNITEGMFQNCATLTTLHLGSGTEYIGNYAFDGTALTTLYVSAAMPPYVAADGFTNRTNPFPGDAVLYVPAGSKALYRNHSRWSAFSRIIEF